MFLLGICWSFSSAWLSQGLSQMAKKKTTTLTMATLGAKESG